MKSTATTDLLFSANKVVYLPIPAPSSTTSLLFKLGKYDMMLDSSAQDLCKEEEPEIISYLPNLKSKDVVELGAGIG